MRRVWPRGFQKIGQNAVDLRDFQANILHHRPRRTGRRQIATDDFDDSGDARERVANLVGQAGGHLAEGRQVLGARNLRVMQALDFFAALPQLFHHVVEVAAEISDFVVAPGEADGDVQIAFTHQPDLLLQFDHGPLNQIGKSDDGNGADDHRSRSRDDQHRVALRVAQRYGRQRE